MAWPSPNLSPSVTSPLPQPSSPPPTPLTSPSSQPNADPPEPATPSTPSPPPQSSPDVVPTAPSPATLSSPPLKSPVVSSPPPGNSPPLEPTISPPPPSPQTIAPSLPPSSTSNPPPPPSNPPASLPPSPPSSEPPKSVFSPPATSKPPKSVTSPPPPPPSEPPKSVPSPSNPSESSPPPPSKSLPPRNSPPKKIFPSPPALESPENAPPLPIPPSSQASPPPSNSTTSSSPSPIIHMAPPPHSLASPQLPFQIRTPPSENPTVNNSTPSAPPASANSTSNGVIGTVVFGAVGGILLLSLIGLVIWCMNKQRKKSSQLNGAYVMAAPLHSSLEQDSSVIKIHSSAPLLDSRIGSSNFVHSPTEPGGLGNSRAWFTYEELVNATNGFSTENLLGEGGFGFVYKGHLPNDREVAVKKLKIGGGQGEREFKAEVEIISRVHHRHLVSLVGYCISDNKRLLVYDYVPNSTLYFHLHGQGRPVLDWATRVKIASGAARGIAYLHEDCHPRIIHRDIKSANILLDNNFDARVSDFGLAKLALDANTHVSTRVMGTFGYMAPEYASSGKLTEKSDVFSFGVVLLELITGRKSVDASQPLGDESLVEWARPLLSNAIDNQNFEGLVDPRLGSNYIESEMFRMIEAAAACIRHSASKRPRMGQVVRAFDSLATSDLTNGMKLGESEVFDSAKQSAEIRLFRMMAFGSQDYSTHFFSRSSWSS